MPSNRKFRVVNQTLGTQPKLGPIPTELIFPWLVIVIVCIFVVYYILVWGWLATLFTSFWGCATWWFVSSNKSFLGKFVGTPRISRGYMAFVSLINPPRRSRGGRGGRGSRGSRGRNTNSQFAIRNSQFKNKN
jgi:hypothetical protein